jgi:hypothetical protein
MVLRHKRARLVEITMTDLSVDARLLETTRGALPPVNPAVVTFASALLMASALALGNAYSWRQGALFLLGGALGIALYHALFGFTSAWRVFIANARGAGLRAQMLMLAVAMLLFFPAIGAGTLFGEPVRSEYGAVGVSVVVGAFLFGLGMQLGGGCASGTLLYRRWRKHAHAGDAVLLHRRLGARRLASAMVVGAAQCGIHIAGFRLGCRSGADRRPDRLRADCRSHGRC